MNFFPFFFWFLKWEVFIIVAKVNTQVIQFIAHVCVSLRMAGVLYSDGGNNYFHLFPSEDRVEYYEINKLVLNIISFRYHAKFLLDAY